VMRLAIHTLSAKPTVAPLTIIAVLVHIARIVWSVVVGVIIGIIACMSLLRVRLVYMLGLRRRSSRMLPTESRVRCSVPAVLSIIVTALVL
jgi:hypothetical protein